MSIIKSNYIIKEFSNINNEKPSRIFKLFFVGNKKVGKQSIYNMYNRNQLNLSGVEFSSKNILFNDEFIQIQFFGYPKPNEPYSSIPFFFYKYCHCILFIYDIADIKSFNDIKDHWYNEFLKRKSEFINQQQQQQQQQQIQIEDLSSFYLKIVIGTKSDLRNNQNYNTCVQSEHVREYAHSIDALFFEVSAKENINLNESIAEIINNINLNFEKFEKKQLIPQSKTSSMCTLN